MNKKDESYFNVAKAISELSEFPRHKIGCCVTYKHKVISSGFNRQQTHPLQKELNKERFSEDSVHHWMHAELSALLPLMNRKDIEWNKVKVYVYRELKNGNKAMARPCPSCSKLLKNLGVKKVYYTTDNGFAKEIFD